MESDCLDIATVSGAWEGRTGITASDALIHLMLDETVSGDGAPFALTTLLPAADEVPTGLILAEQRARTATEVAASFPSPEDAAARLAEWGWQDNAFQTFATDPGADARTLRALEVSLHRFASPAGASRAIPYFAEGRATALGLEQVDVSLMGADEAAVTGLTADGYEATLYVRTGTTLIRVSAVMRVGSPILAEKVARDTASLVQRKDAEAGGTP
jgi:hypothetical protein